jgi:hypothetical protein
MFKNILKHSSIVAIAIVTLVIGVLVGCQKEDAFEEPIQTLDLDLATELWLNTVFDEANSNSVITTVFSNGVAQTKVNPITSHPRLKSGNENSDGYQKPDSTWTSYGTVNGAADGVGMARWFNKHYGNDCYETRIEAARDSDGNLIVDKKGKPTGAKDVYHRPCQ